MNKKLVIIFTLALFLRIFHLAENAQFGYDEARDVIAEKQILSGDLTLLGPESLIGQKIIYFGPWHYYLMAPALAFSNFDPLGPYFWTAFLGAVTAVILAANFGAVAGFFYAVFPPAVIYNRWAWNPNTVPLFISLSLLFFSRKKFFLAGVFIGLATQLHYTAALALIFFINPKTVLGFLIGISPILIFDLRHNFLYARSLLELFSNFNGRGLTWHYFLWAIPLISIFLARFPRKISLPVIIISFIVTIYWFFQLKPINALNPFYLKQIARIIAYDQTDFKLTYNVVSFIGGDFRAHNLRYFFHSEKSKPLDVGEYNVADHLYVVSFESPEKVLYNGLYEISSFKPKRVSQTWEVAGANIYRLEKK